ncbi:kinesin-like protein KIF6 isoform X2 [Brachyhypopomus gauderio]|uniref:kinesin-like protein KIF6 isoform X2 n=1 Tax=Brachyhypopomus gauderio TaxID=698409 RepID=UPI00404222DF
MVKQTIQIFARVKPTKKPAAVYSVDNEERSGSSLEFVVPRDLADGFINNKRESYRFRFLKVFDQASKQEEIFETIAKPVADNVLAGYNGTIFAYGQTGSGKTFTITGGAERYSDRGIIPRTLSYLYQHFSQDSSMAYTTHISYLEIYNEVGYDLLDPQHEASNLEDLPKVTIREDPDQNIHLKNLSLQASANEEEALNLLFLGDTNRMIAETPMNQASTRSHCIFTIHLCGREPGSATLRRSKLHLVDLAGSERVGKTGVGGQILTEAKYINLSLHYLEQVIMALSEKNRSHIPYRNSMMTSVLRDSLGGNCMTTMIATVSAEKTSVDESISTCRFAQRVALIKNEALLNEELDPALLIVRLKKEIQCLKEELAMVTGTQRTDELSQEEMQRLEEQIQLFLDDPDPEVTLDLGPDMRKIHHCFSLLKERVKQKQPPQSRTAEATDLSSSGPAHKHASQSHGELLKVKDMLTQRDNEISILVNMLKKEKRKVQEVNAQLANFTSGGLTSHSSLQSSTSIHDEKRSKGDGSHYTHAQHLMNRQSGPELSTGRQEAFEIFSRDHEDRLTIEDNKTILKQRYAEAKALGEQVNQTRNRVSDLKKQLETRRMQIAAQGVMESQPNSESDAVEETLRNQIEEEKKNYKSTFGRLKGLKTEIEHLQHLLQRSKIKLERDFQDWWTQETTRLQDVRPQSAESSETQERSSSKTCLHDHIATQDIEHRHPRTPPTRDLRALSSTTMASTSIPLTGDHQTDSDILAFLRARQNLLTRTGISLAHTRHKKCEV